MYVQTEPHLGIGSDGDDVHYAELEKQIIMLMADDGEDDGAAIETKINSSRRLGFPSNIRYEAASNLGQWENHDSRSVPGWLLNLWSSGNVGGTGVFIPQLVQKRRRHSFGSTNNCRKLMYKQVEQKMHK
ncbi:uncharacterized protein LOC115727715 [Rhodamnia argentea]|uniref:Uncharacterized protein LOC115727715 n=1 Tax=Rhodamnia argentea TaxID=178133 RepID=A0A8B8MUS2_9MYRT|nr:uncharacterized protein LOC115727715 [Rhodamnia argentea]